MQLKSYEYTFSIFFPFSTNPMTHYSLKFTFLHGKKKFKVNSAFSSSISNTKRINHFWERINDEVPFLMSLQREIIFYHVENTNLFAFSYGKSNKGRWCMYIRMHMRTQRAMHKLWGSCIRHAFILTFFSLAFCWPFVSICYFSIHRHFV